ncbi:MAG: hypothetical protein KJ687_05690, partial [Proteobacteria bacterium]|nr:hypothetical protein [Pseudomonadota bacterium]
KIEFEKKLSEMEIEKASFNRTSQEEIQAQEKKIVELESVIDKNLNEISEETKENFSREVLSQLLTLFTIIDESSGNVAQKALKVTLPVFEKYLNNEEIPDIPLLKQVNSFLEKVGYIDPKGLKNQGPVIIENLYGKIIDNKLKLASDGKLNLNEQSKASLTVAKRLLSGLSESDGIEMYRSILTTIESALK